MIEKNLMDSLSINDITDNFTDKISASSGDWSKLELNDEKATMFEFLIIAT